LSDALKVERLRLAAHMLRNISLHSVLASEKGNNEALRLVSEMEARERGFITRTFSERLESMSPALSWRAR